jgi:hypothetical protein
MRITDTVIPQQPGIYAFENKSSGWRVRNAAISPTGVTITHHVAKWDLVKPPA